jgi:CubicO group peptidase (beta-lactamase class C family)
VIRSLRPAVGSFVFVLAAAVEATAAPAARLPSDAVVGRILRERVGSASDRGIVVALLDSDGPRIVACGKSGNPESPDLDGQTVFEIGSITKTFTATLLADAVGSGTAGFDWPVGRLLSPNVRVPSRAGRPITLGDLATQTSGLPRLPGNLGPRDPANPYADYDATRLYEFLSRYALPRAPGETYEYSNLGFGLLGHALAYSAGSTWEELARRRIMVPLGMSDTGVVLTRSMRRELAAGHDASGARVKNWEFQALAGAGALLSTAGDMQRWLAAQLGGARGPLAAAIAATHVVRHATTISETDIALAWHVTRREGGALYWHNGGTGGYRSWAGFIPHNGTAVAVLSNSSADIDDIGRHLLDEKSPLAKPRVEVAVDPQKLVAWAGSYELAPDFSITVTLENGALFAQATNQPKLRLSADSETDFWVEEAGAGITFLRDASGRATGLVLHQGFNDTRGKKVR